MRIKSFFAPTMAAALSGARQELGPEAMILQSRKTPAESQHLGEYEVVAGLAAEASGEAEGAARPEGGAPRLSEELAALRRELETMHRAIARSVVTAPRWALSSGEMSDAFARLLAAEVEGDLAREVVDTLEGLPPAGDRAALDRALAAALARRIRFHPALGKGAAPRVAALVGPPGAGKTTTLVKLAVAQAVASRQTVALVSIDNFRVAGAGQLRSYAAILGVAFQAVDTAAGLARALEELRGKQMILIDTPGYGSREMDRAAELARFLAGRPGIDVHLVVTASMKSADLTRVAEQFSILRPDNLLFTRLDETGTLGTVYSLAARTGLPVSFLGTGQQIPEDLAEASADRLIGPLAGGPARASRAA